jgi:hypothetical protein
MGLAFVKLLSLKRLGYLTGLAQMEIIA